MNLNKPFVARNTVFVSSRVRRFLSRSSVSNQVVLTAWLRTVQLYLDSSTKTLVPGAHRSVFIGPVALLDRISARAYAEPRPQDRQIPCNVHIAFDSEIFSQIDWYAIYLEGGMAS